MKRKILLFTVLALFAAVLLCACGAGASPYGSLDSEGATVSVKYLAGDGGMFAGTGGVTVVDVFDLADYKENNGMVSIPLIAPDDGRRGKDAFTVSKTGYIFAGWYVAEPVIEDGAVVGYRKGEKWEFDKDTLSLDTGKSYSSSEPVLTLMAGWMEYVTFEIYDATGGTPTLIGTHEGTNIELPAWNLESGKMYYKKGFPELKDKTFLSAYLDPALTIPAGEKVSGEYDYETGELKEKTVKIYTTWREGEWFRISNAGQLVKNASVRGCYELTCDLDFSSVSWPRSFSDGEFKGKFIGNGHTVSGIKTSAAISKGGSVSHGAVFGSLGEGAEIRDVTFDAVTYTVKSAAKAESCVFGLFTGRDNGALVSGVSVSSSVIVLSADFVGDFREKIEDGTLSVCVYSGTPPDEFTDISVRVEGDTGALASILDDGRVALVYPEE